jgi:molybdate transport system permease protein
MVAYHPYSLRVYTYVAFGAEGLPAMMPILLPTLVLAIVVLGLSDALAKQRKSRFLPLRAGRADCAPDIGHIRPDAEPANP